MDAVRLRNFRGLADTGMVILKPITLLVGANSSGKSSFLRMFPLFKQSVSAKTIGPLLWYGNEVDFGTFDTTLKKGESQMIISFYWEELNAYRRIYHDNKTAIHNIMLTVVLEKEDDDASINQFEIRFGDNIIRASRHPNSSTCEVEVNGISAREYGVEHVMMAPADRVLLPDIYMIGKTWSSFYSTPENLILQLQKKLQQTSLAEYAKKFSTNIYAQIECSSKKEMAKQILQLLEIESIDPELLILEESFNDFLNFYICSSVRSISDKIDSVIADDFSSSFYIKPFRASAERYYRWQNLNVNALDSDGHNMAMFVANMYKKEKTKARFKKWTKDLFKFELDVRNPEGHLSLSIKEEDGEEYNIADKGFGYSQILPIILILWQVYERVTNITRTARGTAIVTIEQPELHLHPRLQAKLMDAFIVVLNEANKKGANLKFIIETHSQNMINRLGMKIARKEYDASDATVLLFHEPKAEKPSPQVATYDNEGFLSNWPVGFFDPED